MHLLVLLEDLANLRRRIQAMKDKKKERMIREGKEVVSSESESESEESTSESEEVCVCVCVCVCVQLQASLVGGSP